VLENSLFAVEKSDWRRVIPLLGAVVVAVAGIGYAVYEHNNAQTLAWQNQQVATQLDQTHKQLDATNSQLSSLSAKVDALTKPSPAVPAAGVGGVAVGRGAGAAAGSGAGSGSGQRRMAGRDSHYAKLQSQLDAQGKAIDDTRSDLASARTELSGSIAKTHDELVLLEKRGERSYFEFDLNKSKQFTRTGPLNISLRKANDKRGYADLQLIVDDRTLTQKHVNLYQPAMFYEPDSPQPLEIVINDISKNHIHGYISAPKYKKSELTAMANPAQGQGDQVASADAPTPPQRKKLPVPTSDPNE
jgi:hypothetical protein